MKTKDYVVQKLDPSYALNGKDENQIALLQPSEYSNIFGLSMSQMANERIEGLLKITYGNKSVYRKYIGNSTFVEAGRVVLNYRSISELGINSNQLNDVKVQIEPANAVSYLWNNTYSYIRGPFRAAIYFGIISIILSLVSIQIGILSVIISLCQACCSCL